MNIKDINSLLDKDKLQLIELIVEQIQVINSLNDELEGLKNIMDGINQVTVFNTHKTRINDLIINKLLDKLKNVKLLIQAYPNDTELGSEIRKIKEEL